jgi:hypothetical protein
MSRATILVSAGLIAACGLASFGNVAEARHRYNGCQTYGYSNHRHHGWFHAGDYGNNGYYGNKWSTGYNGYSNGNPGCCGVSQPAVVYQVPVTYAQPMTACCQPQATCCGGTALTVTSAPSVPVQQTVSAPVQPAVSAPTPQEPMVGVLAPAPAPGN